AEQARLSLLHFRRTLQVCSLLRADRFQHTANARGDPEEQRRAAFRSAERPRRNAQPALESEKNRETILRMNELLNDLIAKEVGVNDGRFLAPIIGTK